MARMSAWTLAVEACKSRNLSGLGPLSPALRIFTLSVAAVNGLGLGLRALDELAFAVATLRRDRRRRTCKQAEGRENNDELPHKDPLR